MFNIHADDPNRRCPLLSPADIRVSPGLITTFHRHDDTEDPVSSPRSGEGADPLSDVLPIEAAEKLIGGLATVGKLREVWTSADTFSRVSASLWSPADGGLFGGLAKHSAKLCVGHYGNANSYEKPRGETLIPHIEDQGMWQPFMRSEWLEKAIDHFAPHPEGFKSLKVREREADSKTLPLYAWEPIPPGLDYVSLGMIFTTSSEKPELSSVRCMHRVLCCEARNSSTKLWDDQGIGGTGLSLWCVNNLQLVWATRGYAQPVGPFYELREWPFVIGEVVRELPLLPELPFRAGGATGELGGRDEAQDGAGGEGDADEMSEWSQDEEGGGGEGTGHRPNADSVRASAAEVDVAEAEGRT